MLKEYFYIKLVFFYGCMSTMSGESQLITSKSNVCLQSRNSSMKVKVFAFDFDKTCTTKAILDIYKAREDYSMDKKEILDKEWKRIEQFYSSIVNDILKPLKEPKPMETQFNDDGLRRFLAEVSAGDHLAINELISSNLLQGITSKRLLDFAQNVELMPGLLTILQSLKMLNLPFHVISLNFSEKLIHYVLNREETLPIEIHTNKLQFEKGISTGNIEKRLVSAFDKELQLAKIIETADNNSGVTIYVGDSFTDLLALLKVDIGIIIGQSKSMLKVCNDFGIYVVPLNEWRYEQFTNDCNDQNKLLFSVESWEDIQQFIFTKMRM